MALLELEAVTKQFGGLVAVDAFDMELYEGEILGLIGPNGAGKTTVFNLIMGVLRQDEGAIAFRGESITHRPTFERVEKGLARTYQTPRPFSRMSVLDNVRSSMLPNRLSVLTSRNRFQSEARAILDLVDLDERSEAAPDQLTPGELRRLEIAKALAQDPTTILLDEVFAGITYEEATKLADLIRRLRSEDELTFLVVDHVMNVLMPLVDRVVVMNFGEKIAEGDPDSVVADDIVNEVYLGKSATQNR